MIRVHIERLVLENVPVGAGQHSQLQFAVEHELGRLLANGGIGAELRGGGAVPSLRGGSARLAPDKGTRQTGVQIARAIHGGIGAK
jgi:hypothetical protein